MTRYLKNMEKEITIENQVEEIAIIAQFIEELGMSLHLPSGITMSLNLAIEEAISNIIHHGYPQNQKGEITTEGTAKEFMPKKNFIVKNPTVTYIPKPKGE